MDEGLCLKAVHYAFGSSQARHSRAEFVTQRAASSTR